ncbi:MAG: phage major capsid protein [Pseudomonadota bacterium]
MTDLDTARPASADARSAASEFLRTFERFRDDVGRRMGDLSTRIERLDRKSTDLRRPALATRAEVERPHAKALGGYLRQGDEDAFKALGREGKGYNTAVAAEGGFLVDPETAEMVTTVLLSGASIRSVARVVQVEASAYDVLVDYGDIGAGWITETSGSVSTPTPTVERISIPLYELSASPSASQRILDDTAFDLEAWLAERIADRFLRAESEAFVNGDGINKPSGFLRKPMVANASFSWGSIGYIATGTAGDFDPNTPGDALIDLVYALGAEYRARAVFVMNSRTAGELRKIKDSHGRFLWIEGLADGQPARLLGYPVRIVEAMPDIAADAFAIAFGDFSHGYTIAERPDLRILRDPFTNRPNVTFFATKRVGGDVTDFAAIKTLKFATS